MSFTNDPANNVIDRLRIRTGDTDIDEEGLSDEIYQYILDSNDSNENLAVLEALKALVAKYASYVTEKAGGLFIKDSEKFDHYKKLLDEATNPIKGILPVGVGFTGGIDVDKITENILDDNANKPPFYLGNKSSYWT